MKRKQNRCERSSALPRRETKWPQNEIDPYEYLGRSFVTNQYDPLAAAVEAGKTYDVRILPWLGMQRHYGSGAFSSSFYKSHPEWWRIAKDGSNSVGLSYFFPQVRKERVDILQEAAGYGVPGLVLGCERQVPMLLYNPQMVSAFACN
jgi:hypothetical protein